MQLEEVQGICGKGGVWGGALDQAEDVGVGEGESRFSIFNPKGPGRDGGVFHGKSSRVSPWEHLWVSP